MVAAASNGIANVIAIDDAPFTRNDASVRVVGVVYADARLDGVLSTRVSRDGDDATRRIARMLTESRFAQHVRLLLLNGIAVAGFNVIDVATLARLTGCPVIAVVRRRPDLDAIRRALQKHLPDGALRWQRIAALGPVEPVGEIFIQRAGIDADAAAATVRRHTRHGHLPEPLRVVHLIAGGFAGHSRGRA